MIAQKAGVPGPGRDPRDPSADPSFPRVKGPGPRIFALLAILGALASITVESWSPPAWLAGMRDVHLRALSTAAVCLVAALFCWPTPSLPWLYHGQGSWNWHLRRAAPRLQTALGVLPLVTALFLFDDPKSAHVLAWVVASLMAVVLAICTLIQRRTYLALASLRSPSSRPPGAGPGCWEGSIEDPTPIEVDGAPAAIGATNDFEVDDGSSPDALRSRQIQADGGFVLVTSDGSKIVIQPEGVVWGSLLDHWRRTGKATYQQRQHIPVGGRCVIAGQLVERDGELHLDANDDRHALVLGASAQGRPALFARAAVGRRRLTLSGAGLLTTFVIALAIIG